MENVYFAVCQIQEKETKHTCSSEGHYSSVGLIRDVILLCVDNG